MKKLLCLMLLVMMVFTVGFGIISSTNLAMNDDVQYQLASTSDTDTITTMSGPYGEPTED